MSSVRLGTSREKGPFCYELGEYLDLHKMSCMCPSLKIRILVKFLKGHRGWIPNNSSSAAQSSASIVRITFLLCNPGLIFLHIRLCLSLPALSQGEWLTWQYTARFLLLWIQLLSCLGTAWKQGHYNTLVRMDASSHYAQLLLTSLLRLWLYSEDTIEFREKINDRLSS